MAIELGCFDNNDLKFLLTVVCKIENRRAEVISLIRFKQMI